MSFTFAAPNAVHYNKALCGMGRGGGYGMVGPVSVTVHYNKAAVKQVDIEPCKRI